MPPEIGPYLLGVECKRQGCATFFATPFQLSPDAYGELEDVDTAYRCPRCRTIHRYAKREHVFLLLDEVA
jgi:hypothetical protein